MRIHNALALFSGFAIAFTSAQSAAFSGPVQSIVIDFESSDFPTGSSVNGVDIGPVMFSFGTPRDRGTPGASFGSFPVNTPHTSGKGIEGPTSGLLGLQFAEPVRNLAFGFALLGSQFTGDGSVRDGVIVNLFNPEGGLIGSFSQDADPVTFTDRGGGAEYAAARFSSGSTRIGSATISFAMGQEPIPDDVRGDLPPIDRFFFDNLSFEMDIIPLPSPALLGVAGLCAVAAIRRRRTLS